MDYWCSEKHNMPTNYKINVDDHPGGFNKISYENASHDFYKIENFKMKEFNTNFNHNDGTTIPSPLRERFGFEDPNRKCIRKQALKLCNYLKTEHGDVRDRFVNHPQKTNNKEFNYYNKSLLPYCSYHKDKRRQTKLKNKRLKELQSKKNKTTSNNADINTKQILNVNVRIDTILNQSGKKQCQITHENECSNNDTNKQKRNKGEKDLNPSAFIDVRKRELFKMTRRKSNPCVVTKVSQKSLLPECIDRRHTTKLLIKSNSSTIDKNDNKQCLENCCVEASKIRSQISKENRLKNRYLLKLKTVKQTDWVKVQRKKRFQTVMECVREITNRLNTKYQSFDHLPGKTPSCHIRRHRAIEDLSKCPNILNPALIGINSIRLGVAVVMNTVGKRSFFLATCTSKIYPRLPIIIKPILTLQSFNILNVTTSSIFTPSKEKAIIIIKIVHIFESTSALASENRMLSRAKAFTHHEDLYKNLDKVLTNAVDMMEPKYSVRDNRLIDSWDEISATDSSCSTGTMALRDYKSVSSDSFYKTEDIYGSDFESDNVHESDTECNRIFSHVLDNKFSRRNYSISFVDSLCTSNCLIDEYEILTCELATERFHYIEELDREFEHVILELFLANSSYAKCVNKTRQTRLTFYYCPSLHLSQGRILEHLSVRDAILHCHCVNETVQDTVFLLIAQSMIGHACISRDIVVLETVHCLWTTVSAHSYLNSCETVPARNQAHITIVSNNDHRTIETAHVHHVSIKTATINGPNCDGIIRYYRD